ncbi:YveK family protein [Macrococcus capreoli]|uniref:YveK family protein n=1 Tax=Macrococcus capreoli TaxID=2982690 RepID=UPI003F438E4A
MEEVIDLEKLYKLILRNLKTILGISILGAIIAAIISFYFITPKYSASTQILINKQESTDQLEFQANQADLQLVNTYSEIIKSPVILDQVAKNLKLNKNIQSSVNVSNTAQSKVINITVTDNSHSNAVKIANEITDVFRSKINKIMKVDNVTVLNPAKDQKHVSPIKPKPLMNILIGALLGLIISMAVVILRTLMDKSVKTEEQVREILDLPVIGMIPYFDDKTLENSKK